MPLMQFPFLIEAALCMATMPKYVVISTHPPNSCPSGNKVLRQLGRKLGNDIQKQLKKHKMKADVIFHLDPGHKVLWLLDAPSAETVRDFFYDAGLSRWNDFEFFMTSSMEAITKQIEKLPTVF